MGDFSKASKLSAGNEGGISKDKSDSGNYVDVSGTKTFVATRYGQTFGNWLAANGKSTPTTKSDFNSLNKEFSKETKATVEASFKEQYWTKYNLDDIDDDNVASNIYDAMMNQNYTLGGNGTHSTLANVLNDLGYDVDGAEDFSTNDLAVAAVNKAIEEKGAEAFNTAYSNQREQSYMGSKTVPSHGKGWLKRLNNYREEEDQYSSDDIDSMVFTNDSVANNVVLSELRTHTPQVAGWSEIIEQPETEEVNEEDTDYSVTDEDVDSGVDRLVNWANSENPEDAILNKLPEKKTKLIPEVEIGDDSVNPDVDTETENQSDKGNSSVKPKVKTSKSLDLAVESRATAKNYQDSKSSLKVFSKEEKADLKSRIRSISSKFSADMESKQSPGDDDENRQNFLDLISDEFDLDIDKTNLDELGRARATLSYVYKVVSNEEFQESIGGTQWKDSLFEDMGEDTYFNEYRLHKELGIPRLSDVPQELIDKVKADPSLANFEEVDFRLFDSSKRSSAMAEFLPDGVKDILGVEGVVNNEFDFEGSNYAFWEDAGGDINDKWAAFIRKNPKANEAYLEAKDASGGTLTPQDFLNEVKNPKPASSEQIAKGEADHVARMKQLLKDTDSYNEDGSLITEADVKLKQEKKDATNKAKTDEELATRRKKRLQGAEMALTGLKAAAGILSLSEALKSPDVKTPELSPLITEALSKQKELSRSGMTSAEKGAAMSNLNDAYAGAMKNVLRASGGQRGLFLANQGTVDANRIKGLNQLAAQDAVLHRENIKEYNSMANSVGQMTLTRDMSVEQMRQATLTNNRSTLANIGTNLLSDSLSDVGHYLNPNREATEKLYQNMLDSMADNKKKPGYDNPLLNKEVGTAGTKPN